jgi:hypothetical protein
LSSGGNSSYRLFPLRTQRLCMVLDAFRFADNRTFGFGVSGSARRFDF